MRFFQRSILAILLGLLFSSFVFPPELMKIYQVRMSMAFGEQGADREVYIFTNWSDPKSKQLEPFFENIYPEVAKQAKIYFVDLPAADSKNLTNVNLQFLINASKESQDYFKLRNALLEIAAKNPTEEEIDAYIKSKNLTYAVAPQDLVEAGLKVYQSTTNNFKISKNPTILIYNTRTRQSKIMDDQGDFTPQKVLSALDSLKTPPPAPAENESANEVSEEGIEN